jgi:hypothetical protein
VCGKAKSRRQLEISRHGRKYLREIGWDGMDWIDMAEDRNQLRALVNTVMNLRVP